MRIWRRFRQLPALVVLAGIIVLVLAAANLVRAGHAENAHAYSDQRLSSTSYRQDPMAVPDRMSALFVGDDVLAWGSGYYTYPYIVCDGLRVNCNVDGQRGTGFVNSGQADGIGNSRLIDRLPRDRSNFSADLVVVDAGRNDLQAGTPAFGEGVGEYLRAVRESWPRAQIVTIVPWVMSKTPDPAHDDIVAAVREQSDAIGGVTIDPWAEGWFDDLDGSETRSADDLRPNQAGHVLIGKKLSESLQRLGVSDEIGGTR